MIQGVNICFLVFQHHWTGQRSLCTTFITVWCSASHPPTALHGRHTGTDRLLWRQNNNNSKKKKGTMTSFSTLCSHLSHHSRNSCCHKDKYFICYHRRELSSDLVNTNRLCKVLGTCYHQHFSPHLL